MSLKLCYASTASSTSFLHTLIYIEIYCSSSVFFTEEAIDILLFPIGELTSTVTWLPKEDF